VSGAAVLFEKVSKGFGPSDHRIRGVAEASVAIREGEFAIVTGPSGSGKTTLLNLMAGLARPDEGRIVTLGLDLGPASDRESSRLRGRAIGFVFQFPSLLPTLSAIENVLLPLAFAEKADDGGRAGELLAAVGLGDRARAFAHELSAGEQRRIAIARALILKPRLLLCDEPTGDLDPETEQIIMGLITQAHHEGATVVMSTHNHALCSRASRLLKMNRGVLTES
jgi:ABC-type lipoprotein export system ATPase subunit